MPRILRSPFAPVAVSAVALAGAVLRWRLQGSVNVYTALDKRFYVPDADLGWRVSTAHPIWLGLDVCAVIVAIGAALVVGGFVIRWRERTRSSRATALRVIAWVVATTQLAVPVVAFASGGRPALARDTLPAAAAVLIESGIAGSLDAPAGHYVVESHAGTSITAHLSSGGEAFDARFEREIAGAWDGNPRDLRQPMHAEISVAAAVVDTGVRERSKHAREKYLRADVYPRISVVIERVIAVRSDGADAVAFRAAGSVHLMDKIHAVEITGMLKKPDAAALTRLGLAGDVLLVQGDCSLAIRETALAAKAGDFDGDRIPIHASLVLRRVAD
ncbi:MAG TPA: YceI family protein [Kofleriaceae bacterium]